MQSAAKKRPGTAGLRKAAGQSAKSKGPKTQSQLLELDIKLKESRTKNLQRRITEEAEAGPVMNPRPCPR